MKALSLIVGVALAACSQAPQPAANAVHGPHGMDPKTAKKPLSGEPPATRAFKGSMATMMREAPAYTGDADVDFMQQMRVHHVAAVAMAKAELEYGKDAEARRLAQAVVDTQQKEIEQIDRWLAARR